MLQLQHPCLIFRAQQCLQLIPIQGTRATTEGWPSPVIHLSIRIRILNRTVLVFGTIIYLGSIVLSYYSFNSDLLAGCLRMAIKQLRVKTRRNDSSDTKTYLRISAAERQMKCPVTFGCLHPNATIQCTLIKFTINNPE